MDVTQFEDMSKGADAMRHDAPGRDAAHPSELPARAWWRILKRVWFEANEDRALLIAGGATFYLLLALFPALGAFVSLYGFVADPKTVAEHVAYLGGMLPVGGLDLIRNQLDALASQDRNALSLGFFTGLIVALWSANSGVKALFDAMNVAYGEREKRSFLVLNLWSALFTFGALLVGIVLLISVGVVPAILAFLYVDRWTETILTWSRWPVTVCFVWVGITLMYRYGPSRERAKWRWLTWGATVATVVWLAVSAGFSFYLQNIADYNATYGSLGAVIGFMIWVWLSTSILIVGAELNAEMEHQTAVDSTTGPPLPMGERGAYMADTVAPG